MTATTLKALGLNLSDIDARVLLSKDFNGKMHGLSDRECRIVGILRDFITEYKGDLSRFKGKPITCSDEAVELVSEYLRPLDHEEMWAAFLNTSNIPEDVQMITSGTLDSTLIDTKDIIRRALMKKAAGIILFHNHPSGNPQPGKEDIRSTEKLRDAAKVFEIKVIDHIIVSPGKWFSFAEESTHKFND